MSPPSRLLHKRALHHSSHSSHSTLSHIDGAGDPRMVDVTDKATTVRTATAEGYISLSPEALKLVRDPLTNPKGSVIDVARLASIMAVKKTPELIPLCHSLNISGIDVNVSIGDCCDVCVRVCVKSVGVTGVEMEALVGVSAGLLTIYDMTKSVSHDHTIHKIQLLQKSGGKKDKI